MMSLLPPVGWADVATKHDLAALESRIDLRFRAIDERFATKADLDERFRTLLLAMVGMLVTQTSLLLTVLVVMR